MIHKKIIQFVEKNPNKYTCLQIAEKFLDGMPSRNRVHGIIGRAGLKHLVVKEKPGVHSQEQTMKKRTVQEDVALTRLKEGKKATDSQYKTALRKIADLEREKEAFVAISNGANAYTIKPKKHVKSEATAIWLASDWHVGEKVTMGQTNGINKYNPTISQTRGENFFTNGLRLTELSGKDVTIDTIVLALLGDFITGHLHLDAVENNYMAPVEETLHAQQIIISGIEYILKNSKYKLIVPCHSGNHGRTTKFSHFGSENGHSLEFFMYQSIANYFRDEERVTFIIPEGSHSYVDMYGYKVRFLHGHDVKFGGGVGGITIPLNKAIAQWDKVRKADLTCLGHFHQRFDGGNFIVNGSLIGYNAYALSIKASAEPPAQAFCLIDKNRGKTIVAPIFVE